MIYLEIFGEILYSGVFVSAFLMQPFKLGSMILLQGIHIPFESGIDIFVAFNQLRIIRDLLRFLMDIVVSLLEKPMSLVARGLPSLELNTEIFGLVMDFCFECLRGAIGVS